MLLASCSCRLEAVPPRWDDILLVVMRETGLVVGLGQAVGQLSQHSGQLDRVQEGSRLCVRSARLLSIVIINSRRRLIFFTYMGWYYETLLAGLDYIDIDCTQLGNLAPHQGQVEELIRRWPQDRVGLQHHSDDLLVLAGEARGNRRVLRRDDLLV